MNKSTAQHQGCFNVHVAVHKQATQTTGCVVCAPHYDSLSQAYAPLQQPTHIQLRLPMHALVWAVEWPRPAAHATVPWHAVYTPAQQQSPQLATYVNLHVLVQPVPQHQVVRHGKPVRLHGVVLPEIEGLELGVIEVAHLPLGLHFRSFSV